MKTLEWDNSPNQRIVAAKGQPTFAQYSVNKQGSAHTRWSVAIVGVLLFKRDAGTGPRVELGKVRR